MSLFGLGRNQKTFRPKKSAPSGSKGAQLRQLIDATLGSGNLREAVRLPPGEDLNEWLAVNTVDFFNQRTKIKYLSELSSTSSIQNNRYEYRWADGVQIKKPIEVSAPKYVEYLMDWVESQLDDESIFPQKLGAPFPPNFRDVVKTIFKRLFREFGLIDKKELAPLQELIESISTIHEKVGQLSDESFVNKFLSHPERAWVDGGYRVKAISCGILRLGFLKMISLLHTTAIKFHLIKGHKAVFGVLILVWSYFYIENSSTDKPSRYGTLKKNHFCNAQLGWIATAVHDISDEAHDEEHDERCRVLKVVQMDFIQYSIHKVIRIRSINKLYAQVNESTSHHRIQLQVPEPPLETQYGAPNPHPKILRTHHISAHTTPHMP
ncbi:hypothetical protein Cgig2_022021 [Carnegiea gigantea]|uniref:Uncharacterized protein n=1 Tax=Carnegiea gigantea TaxID=171969 RepID=A0A9Q1QMQ1_9CARY|nr:hypothetical protein Cgig2_022021 [Carnegiea gigantea]